MKIEVLYPEICNLYGDLGNIRYLQKSCPELEVVETDLKSRPAFLDGGVDLVYVGSATERGLQLLVEALTPYRDALADYIDAGNRMLATHAEYHMLKRHSSFFLGKFQDMDIVGFKSVFGHTYPDDELSEALFRVERGVGRRPGSAAEGFRRGGLMATYLIGPLLVLNPPFTKWLLRELGVKSDDLAFEDTAVAAYNARLAEFRDEKINYVF